MIGTIFIWLGIGILVALLINKLIGYLEDSSLLTGVIIIGWPAALFWLFVLLIGRFIIYIMKKIKRKKNEE